jgi:rfaE bifunctional protein kinase chain/domain
VSKKPSSKKVVVIGDVMLDHYLYGEADRISPEAPVPIIKFHSERFVPGGAGNVAANLAALGVTPIIYGIAGDDAHARTLERVLSNHGVADGHIIKDKGRQTTVKQRIMAGQQIVRVDRESTRRLTEKQELELSRKMNSVLASADAVVISDYAKGVVTQAIVEHVIAKARKHKVPVMMNLKPGHPVTPNGPFALQVNRKEAFELALTHDDGSWPRLREAAAMLAVRYEPRVVIITLGAEGIYLYPNGPWAKENGVPVQAPVHIKTVAKEVVDVSGAGDTVLAAYTVGLLDGLNSQQALEFANKAAGKAVAKHGTAVVTRHEIQDRI